MIVPRWLARLRTLGFSRKIVAALKAQDAKFSTFNILADAEVRAELKTFSDWPTYPQLYIGGDLIGGLDIVNEMVRRHLHHFLEQMVHALN